MWMVLALLTLGGGLVAGQDWLPDLTDNLRDPSVLYMPEVNYSEPVINATYVSKFEFDMRAMGHLYNSTHMIIDFIANKQAYPEGIVMVSDGHIEFASPRDEWRTLLTHYAGPIAVVVVVGLLVVIFPLAGLFWCCCQWCRVGRRRRPFDRKYDACLKGILAIVFIGLLTLFLFGVVCAFATDSQIESGAHATPDALRSGIQDARTFLNATQAHARHLLVQNYKELEEQLDATLTSSGKVVLTKLDQFTRATSVQKLSSMVAELENVPAQLKNVQRKTAFLRNKAEDLNAGLRQVRSSLLRTLATCKERPCIQLQEKHQIGQLDTEIQYNRIPDVSELLHNVSALLDGDMRAEVAAGLQVFDGIKRTVDQHVPRVRGAITATGARLAALADEVTARAHNASAALAASRAPAGLAAALRRVAPARRHASRAAAAALLAVLALLAWGLLCGVCGKRPDAYGAGDCCNKGAGASCLLAGVGLALAAGGLVALALLAYFAAGLATARLVCDPLQEPRGSRVFADVERFVQLERVLFDEPRAGAGALTLAAALTQCHANATLYAALQLHRVHDLRALGAGVARRVAAGVAALHTDYPPRGRPLRVLGAGARARLDALAGAGLSEFGFGRLQAALEVNLTSSSLGELAAQLEGAARALAPRGGFAEVARDLREAAAALARLQAEVVAPMLAAAAELNATAAHLSDVLRFDHSSLREAIHVRMRETTDVEMFLNTQGPDLVQNLTREFAERMGQRLQEYVAMVERAANERVGLCGPLSVAFNATRDSLCRAVLMPANGFWISLAWCLALFLPLLVVAQRLARLYRHPDPYPGPLVEAEYLYDAYADRDNVPLANGSKRSTLDIEGKIAEWRGRKGGPAGGGPAAPGGPAGAGGTQVVLEGRDVVCQLLSPSAALIDDLKTRLDAKDEDNESGIHESDAYSADKRRRAADAGAASVAAPGEPLHARRYNDMAPKHWEEGPPRYHGPTEYERPPPYYYPGPTDRQ